MKTLQEIEIMLAVKKQAIESFDKLFAEEGCTIAGNKVVARLEASVDTLEWVLSKE